MTGDIFDVKKFAVHDGPGIRTTVFFRGCELSCWWCHNPEGLSCNPEISSRSGPAGTSDIYLPEKEKITGRNVTVDALIREIIKDRVFYSQSGGGVTVSGGEPMMQMDFLLELLEACSDENISVALDTSGYADKGEFEKISGSVDLFLYDIKLIDDGLHKKYTGMSNKTIFENLKFLAGKGENIWIRVPLIPGITDTDDNIDSIIDFLEGINGINKISLLPYNRICEDKFRRMNIRYRLGSLNEYSDFEMEKFASRFRETGHRVAIGG